MAETPHIDIEYVASLARVELTEAEKAKFADQLDSVLADFERLKAVDVDGVEPTAHGTPVFNVWREDDAVAGLPVEDALRNAPKARENQFVVPKVVEDA